MELPKLYIVGLPILSGRDPEDNFMARTLTINEKIIVHLSGYIPARTHAQAPPEVTQKEISRILGLRLPHTSRALAALKDKDVSLGVGPPWQLGFAFCRSRVRSGGLLWRRL